MCLTSPPNSTHSSVRQTKCSVFFRILTSNAKYRLFRSYCTSYHGRELWSLTTSNISDFCIAWRRRRPFNLEFTVYHTLLFAASYLPIVNHHLCTMNSVIVQSTLCAHACRMNQNSLVRLHHNVYTFVTNGFENIVLCRPISN